MAASLAGTRRLDWLKSQREAAMSELSGIADKATDEDRDLTDVEQAACLTRRASVESLDEQIAVEVETAERQAAYEGLAKRVEPALSRARTVPATGDTEPNQGDMVYRSAGEYIADYLLVKRETDPAASDRMERYRGGLARAHQLLSDNPGVVPEPIVGPVVQTIDNRRPAIDAATRRPLPSSGKKFTRPKVTGHTLVGVQAVEKTDLASRPMTVVDIEVDIYTAGGFINLSLQDRDRTSPAILDLLIGDLAAAYANETDRLFCVALDAAVTQTVSATTGATPMASDPESWLRGIYEAAGLVFAAGNSVPNQMWASVDVWTDLGSLTDSTGRALFPAISPSNAMGILSPTVQDGTVAGYPIAVDANFPPGTLLLGDRSAVEHYEQVGGTLSVIQPQVLGQAVAYYGYAATAVVRPESLVRITSA